MGSREDEASLAGRWSGGDVCYGYTSSSCCLPFILLTHHSADEGAWGKRVRPVVDESEVWAKRESGKFLVASRLLRESEVKGM